MYQEPKSSFFFLLFLKKDMQRIQAQLPDGGKWHKVHRRPGRKQNNLTFILFLPSLKRYKLADCKGKNERKKKIPNIY